VRRLIQILTLLTFFVVSKTRLPAQGYLANIQSYEPENGLSGRFANYIFRDSRGLIWIGTQFGLNRFDGREFLIFNEESGLPFPQVMEIYEDDEGWLWLFRTCYHKQGCIKNLAFLHSITHEVHTFEEHFKGQLGFNPDQIANILADEQGTIFISSGQEVIQWTKGEIAKQIRLTEVDRELKLIATASEIRLVGWYHAKDSLDQSIFKLLTFDMDGNITNRKTILNPSGDQSFYALESKGTDYRGRKMIGLGGELSIATSDYFITDQGEVKEHDSSWKSWSKGSIFTKYNPHSPAVWSLDKDGPQAHNLLDNSIFVLDQPINQLQTVWAPRHILFDEENVVWIAGRNGVNQIQFKPNPFQRLLYQPSYQKLPTRKYISGGIFGLDNDLVLMGALRSNGRFYLAKSNDPTGSIKRLGEENINGFIMSLSKGFEGDYWGKSAHSFFRIKQQGDQLEFQKVARVQNFPTVLCQYYQNNRLWLGTDKGLHYYDHIEEEFVQFEQHNGFHELENSIINHIYAENANKIWLCTSSGLYLFDPLQGILERYWKDGKGKSFLPAKAFNHLSVTNKDSWWLSTTSGLIHWDVKEGIPQSYTTDNGLPVNEILVAHEDDYGSVWLSTNHGLIQFQPNTNLSKIWLEEDGTCSNDFEKQSYHVDSEGKIWLGTTNGFTVFHPIDFKDIDVQAQPNIPLNILEFEQFSNDSKKMEVRTKELLETQEITLKPNEQLFNIRVALADYVNGKNAKYSFRIKGVQDIWQEGKENIIRISGLPYGNYILEIKGRLANGKYSSQEIHLPIRVLQPFYLSKGFFMVSAAVLLGLSYLLFRRRTRRLHIRQAELEALVKTRTQQIQQDKQLIENQAKELQKLDRAKNRFFANVTHELRTPLTLILGPLGSVIRNEQVNNKDQSLLRLAFDNGQHLLKLINAILDLSRLEAGKLELREDSVSLYTLLNRIISQFDSIVQVQGLGLSLNYHLDNTLIIQLDVSKFEIILNNLIANALKFSSRGDTIVVDVSGSESDIIIKVTDTGRGIHQEDIPYIFDRFYQTKQTDTQTEGGTGIGLALSKELSTLFKGSLTVESELGKGSVFEFSFPKREVKNTKEHIPLIAGDSLSLANERMAKHEKGPAAPIDSSDQQYTILIAEDNDDLRHYLQLILGDRFNLIMTENGQVAWQMLNSDEYTGQIDLIISDIMMPVMDGYELLSKLKADERWQSVPIVMLTARAGLQDKLKALRIGVDDYVLKPFDEEELICRIDNLLSNYKRRRDTNEQFVREDGGALNHSYTQEEKVWLATFESLVQQHIGESSFTINALPDLMATSRSQIFRRLKKMTGLTPNQYLREIRLQKARELLETHAYATVKQVCYAVGFQKTQYFSELFYKRFGKLPSDYLRNKDR
jgi:signal transduction histidine kinase/DNA-binding response OmpR family regulator